MPAAVAAVALLLGACGGGGGGGGGSAPTSPTVSSVTVGTPKYSQRLLVTVNGSNLDSGLDASSPGCKNFVLSTTAPNISGSSTAYFTCTVSAVGAGSVDVTVKGSAQVIGTQTFTVLAPQVTLTMSDGASVSGDVVITLDPAKTPITTDNFLSYVNVGFYAGTIMHRVVPGFVVQGGGYLPFNGGTTLSAKPTNAPITLEVGKGLSNVQWSIAMARSAQADSATSQFFVNLVNNSADLDPSSTTAGYAVFGAVTGGISVITALTAVACDPALSNAVISGCVPKPDVVVTSAVQTQ